MLLQRNTTAEKTTTPTMTFHSIVREWCKTYKPMLDNEKNGNRRFYLADNAEEVRKMPSSIATEFSPCVIMENGVEGDIEGGKINRNYPVYFFVRVYQTVNNDAQMEGYEEALYHALQFYTWLKARHEDDPTTTGEYRRINMEAPLYVQPVGPLEDGWVAVLMQFERMEQINLCVDESMYINPEQP